MKNSILPFLVLILMASCSEDCNFTPDREAIQRITTEIAELKAKKADAPTDSQAAIYQDQLDQKQLEMDAAVNSGCE